MKLSDTVRAIIAAGCTPEQILAVIEVYEAEGLMGGGIERRRAADRERKARERAKGLRPSPTDWEDLRQRAFGEHGYMCFYCTSEEDGLQVDHVVPVSRGGNNDISNLVPACKTCNASKGDRLLSEWRNRPRLHPVDEYALSAEASDDRHR